MKDETTRNRANLQSHEEKIKESNTAFLRYSM